MKDKKKILEAAILDAMENISIKAILEDNAEIGDMYIAGEITRQDFYDIIENYINKLKNS